MEATEVPTDGLIDKEMCYICNGILFNNKKEGNLAICQHGWTLRALCSVNKSEKDKFHMINFYVK